MVSSLGFFVREGRGKIVCEPCKIFYVQYFLGIIRAKKNPSTVSSFLTGFFFFLGGGGGGGGGEVDFVPLFSLDRLAPMVLVSQITYSYLWQ